MMKKVQIIPYKIVKGKIYYFLGKRRALDLWQPITGHVGDNIQNEAITEAAKREAREEIGISQFRIFFNTKMSFIFTSGFGMRCKEYVFAADIGEQRVKLEKAEFEKYDFFQYAQAIKKLHYRSQKRMLSKTNKLIVEKQYPKVFVISGPGASGKETVITEVLKSTKNMVAAKTCTTRKKRPSEKANYRIFLSDKEFKERNKEGRFIETNFFNGHWYASVKSQVEKPIAQGNDAILELDINGIKSIKNIHSNVVAIFIDVTLADLKKRFILRGQDTPENIENRLKIAKREMKARSVCDYVVRNKWNKLDQAVNDLMKIIKKERNQV